ncbi:hypothetical protein CY35_17G064100 [Sphagnum magellanicum]|nr:hypothetical protein CY35_17G064100 [Sphagnum magellanicum]
MAARHKVWKIVAASLSVGSVCPRTLLVRRHTGFVRVQGSRFLSSVSRDVVRSEEKRKEVVAATTGLAQGDKFGMDRCFTATDVSAYVKLCGDTNPIHSCESTAQSAGFRGRVVHGMLYAGLFPAIIGSQFSGAVYVSQSLQFRAPLLVGEPVCAEVEVTGITKLRHHYRVTFATSCYKKGESSAFLCGEAVALLPITDPAS